MGHIPFNEMPASECAMRRLSKHKEATHHVLGESLSGTQEATWLRLYGALKSHFSLKVDTRPLCSPVSERYTTTPTRFYQNKNKKVTKSRNK
jgi:hypothetical protein